MDAVVTAVGWLMIGVLALWLLNAAWRILGWAIIDSWSWWSVVEVEEGYSRAWLLLTPIEYLFVLGGEIADKWRAFWGGYESRTTGRWRI